MLWPHPVRGQPARARDEGDLFTIPLCDAGFEGVMNVLRHMGILGGEPKLRVQRVSRRRLRVIALRSGAWHPSIKLDEEVKTGVELGRVTDLFGNVVQVAKAPEGGIVGMMRCFYSVNCGETLAVVSAFDS
jgi:predicted deacylase